METKKEKINEGKRVYIALTSLMAITFLGVGILVGYNIDRTEVQDTSINESSYEDFVQKFLDMYELIFDQSLYSIDKEDLINGAIDGMLNVYNDPYTFYTLNSGDQHLGTSGIGLGIVRSPYNGNCLITQVIEGSPAAKGGLKEKDIIYKIAKLDENKDIIENSEKMLNEYSYLDWTAEVFNFEDKDCVRIYYLRDNEEKVTDVTVGTYMTTNVSFSAKKIDGKVEAYIKISSFLGMGVGEISPVDELNGVLNTIVTNYGEIDHLIFDVRENGGGYVSNFVNSMAYFVDDGTTVMRYRYRDGSIQEVKTKDWKDMKKYSANRYTVIINENTASAAESFALAMKDLLNATIVGQQSYGKGIAQNLKYYDDESVLRYTFAETLPPFSEGINLKGITPDVIVGYSKEDKYIYRGYVEGKASNDLLSLESKELIIKQINLVMNQKFDSFNTAVVTFQEEYGLEANGEFNKVTADYLQMKIYDIYLQISEEILEVARGN